MRFISLVSSSFPCQNEIFYSAPHYAWFQAVEYFAEWSLSPDNVVFLRIQTGVYDPALIGDKPKWYAHQLQSIDFQVYDENSSLSAALASTSDMPSDDNPTGE